MPRIKRGLSAHKRRKNLLKYAKGFRGARSKKYRAAKEALLHAWSHSYRGRKEKKRDFRGLWQIKINAACRAQGLTYSKFIAQLKKAKIALDRKILADLAQNEPEIFKAIFNLIKEG